MTRRQTTLFLNALKPKPKEKAEALKAGEESTPRHIVKADDFRVIPNAPFAYWLTPGLRNVFNNLERLGNQSEVRQGLTTADDVRFLRLFWEVNSKKIGGSSEDTRQGKGWVNFAKGGAYSKYYSSLHLVVNWFDEGRQIKDSICIKYPYLNGNWEFVAKNSQFYFTSGLTWSRRSQVGFSLRTLPDGTIFSDKGSAVISIAKEANLGILNSSVVQKLIEAQMAFGSYEVGVIGNIPIPPRNAPEINVVALALTDKVRSLDTATETSHAFRLPWLLQFTGDTLAARFSAYGAFVAKTEAELARLQQEIDELAFDLYELAEEDRAMIRAESGAAPAAATADPDSEEEPAKQEEEAEGDEEEEATSGADLATLSHALLSWCVGVAFGRWDVRMALDSELIPELQGPFERLPVVAPAGLVGVDGYPAESGQVAPTDWLRARQNVITLPDGEWQNTGEYPLPAAWNGVLVSDPGNPLDLTARVRAVLRLLFGSASERMEDEALRAIRGTAKRPLSLEEYFANPKFFFATHLKGYSRSRRKAPIYWPLTHPDAPDFVVWVYYPALRADTLPRILTEVLGPRIDVSRAEVDRTSAARDGAGGSGPQFRQLTDQLEAAQELLAGLEALRAELRRLVDAGYTPDHDDGVIITASPLHGVFSWKDLAAMFRNVQAGKYPWSHQHGLWAKREGA